MSTYKFSPAQRAAIFSTYGEKCYICRNPLTLKTMQVDHVIPESLLEKPAELSAALATLGRPPGFEVNSFDNWLPACSPCNGVKGETVFEPSPLVQLLLQRTAAHAAAAKALAAETVSQRKIANALNVLERAQEDGKLDEEIIQTLAVFVSQHRSPELLDQPILLTPLYEILFEKNGIQVVRGPYGIGGRPASKEVHPSFNCANCGSIGAWNGACCIFCGTLDDE